MPITSQRIYMGRIAITNVGDRVSYPVTQFTNACIEVVPAYGASVGSGVATVQRSISGSQWQALETATTFTSAITMTAEFSVAGIDSVSVYTSTAGSGGFWDVWGIFKADP